MTATEAKTVLIVEDAPDTRDSLALLFRLEGYDVATAADGQQALEYLRAHQPPAAIILDLMMPVMDGWEFRRAQLGDRRLAGIPVVVHSAAESGPNDRALQGVCAFCPKPTEPGRLLDAVKGCTAS